MSAARVFRTSPWVILAFALLGAALTGLAVAFPLVATDTAWALVCVSLPAGGTGLWLLSRVTRLLGTRILLDDAGITLQIPVWAGGWLRRGQTTRLGWSEVGRLTHGQRQHYPMLLPFVVDEYTLHTAKGAFTITRNICPRPGAIFALVSARVGKPVDEIGLVR